MIPNRFPVHLHTLRRCAYGLALCAGMLSATGQAATSCSETDAATTRQVMRALGTWRDDARRVDFYWNADSIDLPPVRRVELIDMFVHADACLHGAARPMRFFVNKKLIGTSGADGRFVPADPAYPAAPPHGPQLTISITTH
jgi:hypothetical protein